MLRHMSTQPGFTVSQAWTGTTTSKEKLFNGLEIKYLYPFFLLSGLFHWIILWRCVYPVAGCEELAFFDRQLLRFTGEQLRYCNTRTQVLQHKSLRQKNVNLHCLLCHHRRVIEHHHPQLGGMPNYQRPTLCGALDRVAHWGTLKTANGAIARSKNIGRLFLNVFVKHLVFWFRSGSVNHRNRVRPAKKGAVKGHRSRKRGTLTHLFGRAQLARGKSAGRRTGRRRKETENEDNNKTETLTTRTARGKTSTKLLIRYGVARHEASRWPASVLSRHFIPGRVFHRVSK